MFPVTGRSAKATIQGQLANMRDGGMISEHDQHIATLIADVLTAVMWMPDPWSMRSYLMALERKHFCSLLEHPKTQERVMGMLQTPVRMMKLLRNAMLGGARNPVQEVRSGSCAPSA
jgi:3-hydroxyacyl-CoA dehydrogenase